MIRLLVNEFENGSDFIDRCDEPFITRSIFFPAAASFKDRVNGIFNLRHTLDLPASENFGTLKEA
jgi:hypothetical protein